MNDIKELNDEELEKVSGGERKDNRENCQDHAADQQQVAARSSVFFGDEDFKKV